MFDSIASAGAAPSGGANPAPEARLAGDFDLSPLVLGAALLALASTFVFWAALVPLLPAAWRTSLDALELRRLPWVVVNPLGYLGFAVAFTLEWRIPADPRQRIASRGLLQDLGWAALNTLWKIVFLTSYVLALRAFIRAHLSFLMIESAASWPAAVRFAVAVGIDDFVGWGNHWLRHKVPALWALHAVHHSQRELNLLSDLRNHPLEQVVKETVHLTVFVLFGAPLTLSVAYPLIRSSFTRFYHANVRTNLGWLRYVLVTPQSHRVHHSVLPEHRDTNFATTFSIWDRLFGTACSDADVYPPTGVDDARFPHEQEQPLRELPSSFVAQLVYPFVVWAGLWRGRRTRG